MRKKLLPLAVACLLLASPAAAAPAAAPVHLPTSFWGWLDALWGWLQGGSKTEQAAADAPEPLTPEFGPYPDPSG